MSASPMTRSFYDFTTERRYGLLVVAGLVSLAIHGLLYTRVADMRLDVAADIPEKYRETPARKIATFERLQQDPAEPLVQTETGDPESTPVAGISSEELSEIVSAPLMTFTAPPPSQAVLDAANTKEVSVSEIEPEDSVWQPRQEIIQVVDRLVRDDVALLPRREIFAVERVGMAPDYAPAIELSRDVAIPMARRAPPPIQQKATGAGTIAEAPPNPVEAVAQTITAEALAPETTLTPYGEKPGEISKFQPVDNRLAVRTDVFTPAVPDGRKYFRFEIAPRNVNELPVVPKDIVFVQDASRSLANTRLKFCGEGLVSSLKFVAPDDRFNVVSFRDKTEFCFPGNWARPTPENLEKATTFIRALESQGETDLFTSLKSLMTLPRDRRRPLIVIIVTDGLATAGLTSSTDIIGEFSKLNDNMSVFVVGTRPKANAYLLDMLSFCNRGGNFIVTQERYGIEKAIMQAIESIVASCSYPILGRIGVDANLDSRAEFFPRPSANLYANSPLVYYGSCPQNVNAITMQVRGEGGNAKLDCLFEIDLSQATPGGSDIKDDWARRKMHALIGEFARTRSPSLRNEMKALSRETGVPIPYMGAF